MKLNDKDRLILYNQYRILEKLYPDDKEDAIRNQNILLFGYELFYDNLINLKNISKEVCNEVYRILTMYQSLFNSYLNLKDKKGIDKQEVTFKGFNCIKESKYYFFSIFVIKEEKRYKEFKDVELKSNSAKLDTYKIILENWQKTNQDYNLTRTEIIEIIG